MTSSTSREWAILAAVSLAMIFATGTTFASLGVVLFAMADAFGWSAAQSGGGFTVLVVACCLTQMIPVATMPRIGARWTMVAGFVLFAAAFLLGAAANGLAMLYGAIALAATAFTLVSNTPGVYLMAGWSGARAGRMIGLYLMIGTLGSALGPPVAQALVASAWGWRAFWIAGAATALLLAAVCAALVREPPAHEAETGGDSGWTFAGGFASARFLVLAAAMVATQFCVVTVSSVAPAHLVGRGWSDGFAAGLLGAEGLVGALGTGASGFVTRWLPPRPMLMLALLLEAAGMLLLAGGRSPLALGLFVPAFGVGWSVTSFAVTVLLVDYFGHRGGSTALAAIWMLTGLSALGPWLAGLTADAGYGFGPSILLLGLLLLPVAAAALLLARRSPQPT